jgi:hypothetical protein
MSDFAPGDVVVCVDDSPCRCCGDDIAIRLGTSYRVARAYVGLNRPTGKRFLSLRLVGVDNSSPHHWQERGINAARFRKIRPADESFTRQMRALRPIKTRVEA